MSEVIIFLLYLMSAGAIGVSCLPRYSAAAGTLFLVAWALAATGASIHSIYLYGSILIGDGFNFSFGNTVSMIGVELALVGLIAAIRPALRGISAGLLLLGAIAVVTTGFESSVTDLT
ncbi:MAG: hypothetical protein HOH37_00610, partial [Gammaproteobacteria bacterium]|nr:hypothetical protein [Gammaproteobacteria bacterium]